ncbi:hypothetical protein RB653_009392 [Dictyostelium firmibasis]|uniref:Uncharacterized protein n=1 Tax=Dictyostelium firmibasis TaxID=79012 RepID=A0AAN7YTR1_9MYCE
MNNINNDPFKTPKFKRPLTVDKYPLNKINNNNNFTNQQQYFSPPSPPQQQQPVNNNNPTQTEIATTTLNEIEKEQFKKQIEELIKEIQIIKQETENDFRIKENQLRSEISSISKQYDNLKEFSETQDQLIKNQYFEIEKQSQKSYQQSLEVERLLKKTQSQEQQIGTLLETTDKNKRFSSDLLIKNAQLNERILELENRITQYEDGTISINDNEKQIKQQLSDYKHKLQELHQQNQRLQSVQREQSNQKSKSEQTLQTTLSEKLNEINALSSQIDFLELKLRNSETKLAESINILNEYDQTIKNFEETQQQKDQEFNQILQINENLKLQVHETEIKYRQLLTENNNNNNNTNNNNNNTQSIIFQAKKETKSISQEVNNIKDLLKMIDSTIVLPKILKPRQSSSIFDNVDNYNNMPPPDPNDLLSMMKFIREELYSLNLLIHKKCSQLLQIHDSNQEFNINPSNCSFQ